MRCGESSQSFRSCVIAPQVKKSFQSDELNVEKEDQVAAEADSNLI